MAKDSNKSKPQKHNRDAGSGKYVTDDYAKKHPKTTVTETDKPKKKKP
jgi:hypothetical protein